MARSDGVGFDVLRTLPTHLDPYFLRKRYANEPRFKKEPASDDERYIDYPELTLSSQ